MTGSSEQTGYSLPSCSLGSHTDSPAAAGVGNTGGRRGIILDTHSSLDLVSHTAAASTSSTGPATQHNYQTRPDLTPMEQSHHCVSQHSEGCSETVWRLPKKSVSSPVLSALSSTPTPVSPRPISPLDIRRSSPKPPPYTSLPPPLMAIPPTPPLQYALNGIPMSIPVRVPIHNSMPDAVSQAGSARQRTTDETEDEEDEGREDNGDELIYTSRNGSRAGGSAPLHEPALNNGTSRFVSTPNRHPLPPPTHTSHHPSHVSYPGLTKARTGSNTSLRRRIFAVTSNSLKGNGGDEGANGAETEGEVESDWEHDGRPICTAPGMVCAGETETETDEPVST